MPTTIKIDMKIDLRKKTLWNFLMTTKIYLKARIREGEIIPWYMGLAYHDFDSNHRVAVIVPFNWVVRAYREFQFYVRFPQYNRDWNSPRLGRREEHERSLAIKFRRKLRNEGHNNAINDVCQHFTRNEMEFLEDIANCPELSEKSQHRLDDIYHNYRWLYDNDRIETDA